VEKMHWLNIYFFWCETYGGFVGLLDINRI